jgi:hypothetical protein
MFGASVQHYKEENISPKGLTHCLGGHKKEEEEERGRRERERERKREKERERERESDDSAVINLSIAYL